MIYVILMHPKNPGNVGAVARAMKNFGFCRLVLIGPHKDIINEVTRCRAKHAQDILSKAVISDIGFFDAMDYLVGTTARLGSEYNLSRVPLSPESLAAKVCPSDNLKVGIVFGREDYGLKNKEIEMCDFIVSIPGDARYPVLNISHAVAIILYELSKRRPGRSSFRLAEPASHEHKENIMKLLDEILPKLDFSTQTKRQTQLKGWKRMLGKAMLTKREAFVIFGFLKKLSSKLK